MSPLFRRALALAYGAVSHSLFALAIAAMIANLWSGMTWGLGELEGASAWTADALLALQFPALHSLLLTQRGRRWLARLAPRGLGKDLASTTYAAIASLQVLATFTLWSPISAPRWSPGADLVPYFAVLFGASWTLLVKALWDGGLGAQTGWIGWTSVYHARRPRYGPLPTQGLFACCRQPIYLAFALTLWTGPSWSADHLLLAALWSAYCWIAPLHKEKRYEQLFGADFAVYRRQVPYLLPRLPR